MAPWWLTPLLFIGSSVLSAILRPKPETEKLRPKGLGDFKFPTASEQRKQPIVWGTVQLQGPNVVWYGDLKTRPIMKKTLIDFAPDIEQLVGYRYAVGFQMTLCRGKLDALRRIWVGDKLLWEGPETTPGMIDIEEPFFYEGEGLADNNGIVGTIDYHDGDRLQAVDAYLATQQSPTPAYRGCAYLTWRGPSTGSRTYEENFEIGGFGFSVATTVDEGYLGNSEQIEPWKIEVQRCPNGLALGSNMHQVNGLDANPANVFYELITDDEFGLGLPASDIDLVNFAAAGETLFNEGQGWSFNLDSPRDMSDIVKEIERQIDGLCFLNRNTGKFEIKLIRDDYTLSAQPLLDASNVLEILDWKVPDWADTVNQVFVNYSVYDQGVDDWKDTSVGNMDPANFNIQQKAVPVDENYPGCKHKSLANKLSARDVRGRSRPWRSGALALTQQQYDINPGDVRRFTWGGDLNYIEMALRINDVKLTELDDGKIIVSVSQDVFGHSEGIFTDPQNSGWTQPGDNLSPIPVDEDQVFEVPRAFVLRSAQTDVFDRIWAGAREQGEGANSVHVFTRFAAGAPSGSFAYDFEFYESLRIGQLNTNLVAGTNNPTTSGSQDIRVDADEDTIALLAAELMSSVSAAEIGQQLLNMVAIGDEILAARTVINNTTHILLREVYRGFLDTAPRAHAAATKVYILKGSTGATVYPRTNNIDVKLRPRSAFDMVTNAEASTIAFQLRDRGRAPYPTTALTVNGNGPYPTASQSLDATTVLGSGVDQIGVDVDFGFRDFAVFDQVQSFTTLSGGFPTDFTTQVRLRVTNDPAGSPTVLITSSFVSAIGGNTPITATRTAILAATDGVVPSTLRLETMMQHAHPDPNGGSPLTLAGYQNDYVDAAVASAALAGKDNTGARDDTVISASFTANATGTYTFVIGTNLLSTGLLEVQLNGGGFVTVIATGTTSGTIAITTGNTVEWRHTQTGPGTSFTFLAINNPSAVLEAYGVLKI